MKIICAIGLFIFIIMAGCETTADKRNARAAIVQLSDVKTYFPETAGYEAFKANCISCHSLRYIEMQPDFPRKTWENIVHKMVKNFGAPIPDSTATAIVDYLMTVKSMQMH